ncbi:uncharacterized protein C9orf152 isoform X1 [Cottoperca gobio]|uniref:Uncharacterized protein C9orf152 isoform X1 n=1 Tax=Cottoperca gobio TaxID=56716 RepID=A0A6J2PEP1_COTGO|nr:uncharacterized protein C9orf152 homolog isoform X1 [Cottoperca gobio]
MSCSRCCCVGLLDGSRKKERLVRRVEEQEEDSTRNMDISLLREQYRSTREAQRRHTQVLLFRTVSEELSEAVGIVPVTQGLASPWEPDSSSPSAVTFDPDPTTGCDPWHVHLDLHLRSRPCVGAQLTASSPETTNTNSSSRRSSSSESVGRKLSVDSPSESPCSSSCSTKEEDHTAGCRAEPEETDPPHASTNILHEDLQEKPCATGNIVLQRKLSAPALRLTRQLSVGGVGSSTGGPQNHNYHPFPNRKTPRISEAARRLGMYSSF